MPPQEWRHSLIVPILKQHKPANEVSSYRPISLTSCLGKLVERMIHRRIEWLLDERDLLPPCMTGFRRHLSCQDALLDFVSDVDNAAKNKQKTAAVFFDVKAAFDMVPVDSVMQALNKTGVGGKAASYIQHLIADRTFSVRLGTTLSSSRKQSRGVPQGSVLSPLLFNLVMAGLPSALTHVSPDIRLSIYADDVCVWTCGKRHRDLHKTVQETVDAACTYFESQGLTLSTEKTKLLLLGPGNNWAKLQPITLHGTPINRTKVHKFLGLTLDSRLSWVPYVAAIKENCLSSSNMVRHISGPSSGCPQRTAVSLHNATTAARVLFGLPYARPSPSAFNRLEALHRSGLRHALGIPPSTRSVAVLAEAKTLPLRLAATQKLLQQLARLHKTSAGRSLLQRLRSRSNSRFSATIRTFDILFPSVQQAPKLHPPWRYNNITIGIRLPDIRKKCEVADHIAQKIAADHLAERFGGFTHLYTDASIDAARGVSAIAFHAPSLDVTWAEAINRLLTSTDAELLAISKALDAVSKADTTKAVIISDSRGALARISSFYERCAISARIRNKVEALYDKGVTVALQWVPSHKGIPGNEVADQLCRQASTKPPSRTCQPTASCIKRKIKAHVWSFHPDEPTALGTAPPPCLTAGLTRKDASLLLRIRTSTDRTNARLFKHGRTNSPLCRSCHKPETIVHLLGNCQATAAARADLSMALLNAGITDTSVTNIIFPLGSLRKRRIIQSALLRLLTTTGLHLRL